MTLHERDHLPASLARVAWGCAWAVGGAAMLLSAAPVRAAVATAMSDGGTLDSRRPVVAVASPAGGERFAVAAVETLRWSVAEDLFAPGSRPVRVELYDGVSVVWADSLAATADGLYAVPWSVPDLDLPAARLVVSAVDAFGLAGTDTSAAFTILNAPTDAPDATLPARDALAPNAPNPFNPRTTLQFELAAPATIELAVFDLAGRRVRTLAVGAWAAGRHTLIWDGRDAGGQAVPSGAYFARLGVAGAGRGSHVVRMTLIK